MATYEYALAPASQFAIAICPNGFPPITQGFPSHFLVFLLNLPSRKTYNSRKAVATGKLAARIAGKMPPKTPIASANTTPITSRSGVILKANARLEKV